jgi:tetratricopeptide (TPR) repeat protein
LYNRAIELEPGRPYAYQYRAYAYLRIKKRRLARQDFKKALAINKELLDSEKNNRNLCRHRLNIAACYLGLGDAATALEIYARIVGQAHAADYICEYKCNAEAVFGQGRVLEAQKNFGEALEHYLAAIAEINSVEFNFIKSELSTKIERDANPLK